MRRLGRIELEARESHNLAPYAFLSCRSDGRAFEEEIHVYQTDFQIDRERIIRSGSFAKLEHKSKLVFPPPSDRFRSRLGRVVSASSLARSAARGLGLNEELAEAIALGRDLGCPPLGKTGIHTLNQLMRDHGGFQTGAQSRRLVEELEMVFPQFNGLNLTAETREGIWWPGGDGQPLLEAQLVDCVQDCAAVLLDLADALEVNLVDEEALAEDGLWAMASARVNERFSRMERMRKRRLVLHQIESHLLEDLGAQSAENLQAANPSDCRSAQRLPRRLIGFSIETLSGLQNLGDFLERQIHRHPDIARASQRAALVLQELFAFYRKNTHLIDDRAQLKIKKEGADRAVCDYLSGLSDAEVFRAYTRHVGTDDLLAELSSRPRDES